MDIPQIASDLVRALKPAEFRMGDTSRRIVFARTLGTAILCGALAAGLWLLQRSVISGGDEPASGAVWVAAVVAAVTFLFRRRMLLRQHQEELQAAMRRKGGAGASSRPGMGPGAQRRTGQGGTAI